MALTLLSILIVMAVISMYVYIKRKYSYFERHGIPVLKPKFPFGNVKGFGKTIQSSMLISDIYKQLKGNGPFAGMYFFFAPFIIALDLNFVKRVLVTDFEYFQGRGLYYNEKDDPLAAGLFSIEGEKWRKLRAKLTPTFTSGKMKYMYSTIVDLGDRFNSCISDLTEDGSADLEMKELNSRFTIDIIGTCAFGIECNSLKYPNSEFSRMGREIFRKPKYSPLMFYLFRAYPNIMQKLRYKRTKNEINDFFFKIVNETVAYRESNNVQRNDFMNLLIKLRNDGHDPLTLNELAAQIFLFFIAGFETSSTTMTFALYELARHPNIQTKARKQIKAVLEKHNGKFSYDAMMDMHYIEQIVNETLRMHPPGGHHVRMTSKDYPVPDTKNIIPKGTLVLIPVYGIHNDPDIYPNPTEFKPERFAPDEMAKRHKMAFTPFGEGPRICIGLRFGMMQTIVGLVTLLLHYEFSKCSKTMDPLVIAESSLIRSPKGGMYLNVKKL